MTALNEPTLDSPTFSSLVDLRRAWRTFHEKQDRENADRVFHEAGVEAVSEGELKFFPSYFRAKLNEFGRDWERALAARALREGFSFYRLHLEISIDLVTAFHSSVEEKFAQTGAALFFESNGLNALENGKWDAVFYFTLKSSISPESLEIEKLPSVIQLGKFLKVT